MGKVEYDLNNSNFITKLDDWVFYFSSEFNQDRFGLGYPKFVVEETQKLFAKYHVKIDIHEYLTLVYYKKIEKRGFKVLTYNENNDIIEIQDNYIFR